MALDKCTPEELLNAYDNSILYTDFFLSQTILSLKKLVDIPVVMLYISDHGESLGEYGLYLHGTPYAIAPDVQKEIPFIIWMSESFQAQKGIKSTDLIKRKNNGHDNIFHSVLGAFDMVTPIYNKEKDVFRPLK